MERLLAELSELVFLELSVSLLPDLLCLCRESSVLMEEECCSIQFAIDF